MADPGLTSDEVVVKLRAACAAVGNPTVWAAQRGLQSSDVSQILSGHKEVTKRVALALGLRQEARYFPARRSCST